MRACRELRIESVASSRTPTPERRTWPPPTDPSTSGPLALESYLSVERLVAARAPAARMPSTPVTVPVAEPFVCRGVREGRPCVRGPAIGCSDADGLEDFGAPPDGDGGSAYRPSARLRGTRPMRESASRSNASACRCWSKRRPAADVGHAPRRYGRGRADGHSSGSPGGHAALATARSMAEPRSRGRGISRCRYSPTTTATSRTCSIASARFSAATRR